MAGTTETAWDAFSVSLPLDPWPEPFPQEDRYDIVIYGGGGVFEVSGNLEVDGTWPSPWEFRGYGVVVRLHSRLVEEVADVVGVDARLIKAIMYVEVTHGGSYGYPAQSLGLAKSILPMNVRVDKWGKYFAPPGQARQWFSVPFNNIKAAAIILKGIGEHVPPGERRIPRIRKIATLYNNLYARRVSAYGARVAAVYALMPWN